MPPEPPPIHPDRLRQSLFRFVDLLESRHIPYMIIGAMAVAMWGQPRATADVDFTVLTGPEGLEALGAEAERQGFVIDRQWQEWHPLQRDLQVRLTGGGAIIDVSRPRDVHDEAALARRRALEIGDRSVWFVSAEDLIVMKLKAGRPRDFEDVVSVLSQQRDSLDIPYMEDWAVRMRVYDELWYVLRGGKVE